ncbi:MAG: ATP-binding cassette domain-containing protein [Lachnospiraceae bacterium]
MKNIVSTNMLTKKFGIQTAVKEISVQIEEGAIYGLVGRNGAGKTSFMKMISGLSHPTSGEFSLFGRNSTTSECSDMFAKVGCLIETPGFFGNMSAYDNLLLKVYCCKIDDKEKYINHLLELVDLQSAGRKKVKNYSLGMKQRLGVAMALVGTPQLLVLDEPINGLDPQGIAEMRELILKLNKEYKITVIISSHILDELSKLVTSYGFLDHGQLIYDNSVEGLEKDCQTKDLSLEEFYFQLTGGKRNV